MIASQAGNLDAVKVLVAAGANVNAKHGVGSGRAGAYDLYATHVWTYILKVH